ncbi:MAG: M1 family metallopeptidase [Cytophagales bacterium]|nr:M1 family metallopeptidase [Cytophagales bacterium]MDW8383767.1 M1 family metallopeptidase [Flammeovirgaceae bacterium]
MRFVCLLYLFAWSYQSIAQSYNPNSPPNTYRSKHNPYYWKNRPEARGTWQQDVYYQIHATIDDSANIIEGTFYQLTYWNNSPFNLYELYFHLYENAFQPGSHYHALWEGNRRTPIFGKQYESKGLGIVVQNVRVNGLEVDTAIDNTIMQVKLKEPLKSGDSCVITMQFRTYYDAGSMRRRNKMFESYGYKHFNGCHWYPIIAVYDAKLSWNTDQHLDKEFYANFGTFDVTLTFPQEYIVEATGTLLNKEEVLPDTLLEKLNIENFKEKPWGSPPSVIIPKEKGKMKSWRFYAENVHNFAFTASPIYRIGRTTWRNIEVICVVQEPHASRWQQTPYYTAALIKLYSEDFGMYAYPKIVVADAQDGMEYPMLVLCGGQFPSHAPLIAHEVGHNWFYGMVANNEQYRAALDEGLTQFMTVWALERFFGEIQYPQTNSKYINRFRNPYRHRYFRLYYGYIGAVYDGFDYPLNTHSADFRGAIRQDGGYGLVYFKFGTMLYNLQYVLGEELFLRAIRYYFEKWKFRHPYFEDFRQSIIEYTQTDLNWFFDQWLETTKICDYSIERVRKLKNDSIPFQYAITFKRKGEMQMPLDVRITTRSGLKYNYYIPNTSWFNKQTTALRLPPWIGWGKIRPKYTAVVSLPEPIQNVQIDTSYRLADIDLTNNKWKGNYRFKFDSRVPNAPDWYEYSNKIRPDIWYNQFDGFQIGLHAEGDYMKQDKIYRADLWYNTGWPQQNIPDEQKRHFHPISVYFNYKKRILRRYPTMFFNRQTMWNAGLIKVRTGIEKLFQQQDAKNPNTTTVSWHAQYMRRNTETDKNYLLYPSLWTISSNHFFQEWSIKQTYAFQEWEGKTILKFRTPFIMSSFNYSFIELESQNNKEIGKFRLRTRFVGRSGFGDTPIESAWYMGGANPEQLIENRFTRAGGFIPTQWLNPITSSKNPIAFQMGGGSNVRGMALYPFAANPEGSFKNYISNSGIGLSAELDFDKYFEWKPKLFSKFLRIQPYVFADAGIMPLEQKSFSLTTISRLFSGQWHKAADAGIGSILYFKFGDTLEIEPLQIRIDMPLWLYPSVGRMLAPRWIIGIGKSFEIR